jgi:deoxyribodipyrimidine photo-lyase
MQRAQRAFGNPALDFAIEIANARGLPVFVFFAPIPTIVRANARSFDFLFRGVADLAADVEARGATFVYRPFPDHRLDAFLEETRPALLVSDEDALRDGEARRRLVAKTIDVPFATVDADVLVPTALFPNAEYAARTLRPKYRRVFEDFIAPPSKSKATVSPKKRPRGADPAAASVPASWRIDRSVGPVADAASGPRAARKALAAFVARGLSGYAKNRNAPELDATSKLSAFLHYGHLGPFEVVDAVLRAEAPEVDRDVFLEEFLVRRELAVNYALRTKAYDALSGCPSWALKTLDERRSDPRPYDYDDETLRFGRTHDPLFNAGQREMVATGRMHGYVRMYWAKKLLEWSATPREAFDRAVAFNDAYELDGRDPNGYTGIAWAIGGVHDRPWGPARPVFGTVRCMTLASTGKKFDLKAYVARVDEAVFGA